MLEILVVFQVLHDPIFFDGFITNQFNVLLPVGLLSQLIERCTVIAEVKVEGLKVINDPKCNKVYNYDDLLSYEVAACYPT